MEKLNTAEIDSIIWHLRNSMNNGDTSKCAGRLEEYIYELTGYEPKPKIVPKFKIGDRIKKKGDTRLITIKDVRDNYYIITFLDDFGHCYVTDKLSFSKQGDYELIPNKFDITTLKPFDKVLVRGDVGQKWIIDFFGFMDRGYPFVCVGHRISQCIPYEQNEHLLNTTNDCDDYYKTWK